MDEQRIRQRGVALAVGIIAILILLTACGTTSGVATIDGGDGATPTPSPSAGPEDPEEAMYAFAECMRDQGIDMPDPVIRRFDAGSGADSGGGVISDEAGPGEGGGPPFDPNSDEFIAAQEECGHLLEGLGALEAGEAPELSPEQEEAFLAFTECMREHGIDMPDFGSGGAIRIGPGSGDAEGPSFDPRSEEFQAAREQCDEHLEDIEGLDGPRVEVNRP
jgi:hypothetical protein